MPDYTTFTLTFTPITGGPDTVSIQKFQGTKFIDKKTVSGDHAAILAEEVRDIFEEE